MKRLILTFETMFQVLAADKALRETVRCRPTPTPAGLSADICGMSLEILDETQKESALELLGKCKLTPRGVHLL